MFTDAQLKDLKAPLSSSHVRQREQGGRKLSYVEGWHAIAEANRIFGFDGWARETVELKCVSERDREIGRDKVAGWGVTYIARVRVTVTAGEQTIIREGCGTGHGIDRDLGQAHESALKEAETDAMKRALMTFGNPFGLALYDKDQANVVDDNGSDESVRVYIDQCEAFIAKSADAKALLEWWNSAESKNTRANLSLTNEQVNDLKAKVIARREALEGRKAA